MSKIPDLEKKHRDLELENQRMLLRIQQLEQQMVSGLRTSDSSTYSSFSSPASFPNQQFEHFEPTKAIKQEENFTSFVPKFEPNF